MPVPDYNNYEKIIRDNNTSPYNLEQDSDIFTETKTVIQARLQELKPKHAMVIPATILASIVGTYVYGCYLDSQNYDPKLTAKSLTESHYTIKSIPSDTKDSARSKDFEPSLQTLKVRYDFFQTETGQYRKAKDGKLNYLRIKDGAMVWLKCDKSNECEYQNEEGRSGNNYQKVTINPEYGARIIPCPGSVVETAIKVAHANKLETIALMGTGTTRNIDDDLPKTLESIKNNPKAYPFVGKYPDNQNNPKTYTPAGDVFVRLNNNTKKYNNYPDMLKANNKKGMLRKDFEKLDTEDQKSKKYLKVRDAGYVTYFNKERGTEY